VRIVVLGSAAGGGFPQWNCNCANCRRARTGDPFLKARTQSSLAVTADEVHWYVLNASPDIRQQIERTPHLQPRGKAMRASPIAGAVLTNADVDHVAGLLSLRERQPLTIYATARVLRVLSANAIFGVLDPALVTRRPLSLGEEVSLDPGKRTGDIAVTGFPVPGKVALWLEDAMGGDPGGSAEDTIGLEVADRQSGGSFFYIPGCAAMTPEVAQRLRGAPLVFFDGTTWTDDEMRMAGVGEKTAARMGHMSMAGPAGSITAFGHLDVRRKIYLHINNTNPVLRADSPERREAEARGWEIAEDGMEVTL
jgi:pyrroloquinoline quinone biosynthesis protein B